MQASQSGMMEFASVDVQMHLSAAEASLSAAGVSFFVLFRS